MVFDIIVEVVFHICSASLDFCVDWRRPRMAATVGDIVGIRWKSPSWAALCCLTMGTAGLGWGLTRTNGYAIGCRSVWGKLLGKCNVEEIWLFWNCMISVSRFHAHCCQGLPSGGSGDMIVSASSQWTSPNATQWTLTYFADEYDKKDRDIHFDFVPYWYTARTTWCCKTHVLLARGARLLLPHIPSNTSLNRGFRCC